MDKTNAMQARIRAALRQVIDPEVGVNVLDLGLIYSIEVKTEQVSVTMTMTTPACPMGSYLLDLIDEAVRQAAPEIADIGIELVWDPPWDPHMMSSAAKQQLGWDR